MRIDVSSWPLASVLDFLADYRGYIDTIGALTYVHYYPAPKVA